MRQCKTPSASKVMGISLPEEADGKSTEGSASAATSAARMRFQLFRPRDAISYQHFKQYFIMHSREVAKLPVLRSVLKHEQTLPLIKYVADILAWQVIVFKVIKPGSVSREVAGRMINKDIIFGNDFTQGLPVEERQQAEITLSNFCRAFNATITLPGFLRYGANAVVYIASVRVFDDDCGYNYCFCCCCG